MIVRTLSGGELLRLRLRVTAFVKAICGTAH